MPTGSKEFDLLCACAAVEIAPERAARIASAKQTELDWNEFLRLAELHGVLALVARGLSQYGAGVPTSIQQSLQQSNQTGTQRSLWFASELARILQHFEKRGLKAVPYKGPVLAESAYGDLALRKFNDLDFLIFPAAFDTAKQVLAELDYRPSTPQSAPVERFWLKYGYECMFDGKPAKHLVELQWALLPHFFAVDLRVEEMLARSTREALGAKKTLSLCPEDSLLVLCLHAGKHLWERLIWICDIAETMRTQTIDYSAVIARARKCGILRIVGISAWLAANLLDANLDPAVQEILASDPEVEVLGKVFSEQLSRGATCNFESQEYFRFVRRLRERPADRLRYLWRLTWTPGVGDLAAVSLPEPLFPLYRVVRIGRLLRRLARSESVLRQGFCV
jgi:hypothetical protein